MFDSTDKILAWSTLGLTLATFGMLLLAYIGLLTSERTARYNVYRSIMEMLDETKEARESINKLINEDEKSKYDWIDHSKNKDVINKDFENIIRSWDQIALMWEHRVIPESFIMEYYSKSIVTSWFVVGK